MTTDSLDQTIVDRATEMLNLVKTNLDKDGHVVPVAFFFDTEAHITHVVGIPDFTENKAGFTQVLKDFAKKNESVAVMVAIEAWSAPVPLHEGHDSFYARHGGTLENVPDRGEVLVVSLDMKSGMQVLWLGPIERDSEDKPTVKEWRIADSAEGRFLNLFK